MSNKFAYKFSNLCGAVYKQGRVVFSHDGNSVLSPVGNRISKFDLKNNKSCTFPFENQKNVYCFAVSPDGLMMISVDEEGRAILVNLYKKVVLHHFNFKKPVYDIKYSPNGRYFAVTHGRRVQLWHAPGHSQDFAPLSLYQTLPGQYDDALCLDWSDDSNFLAVGSRDTSCRVFSVHPLPGFHYVNLAAHRTKLIACFFEKDSLNLYTVAKDGAVVVWECSFSLSEMQDYITKMRGGSSTSHGSQEDGDSMDTADGGRGAEEGEELQESSDEDAAGDGEGPALKKPKIASVCFWAKKDKHLFPQDHSRVTCATYHKPSHLLVVGFNSGIFSLYEMPDFNPIHTLSVSQQRVTSVAVNVTGEWLAFGCASLGQLLVWEWQSESYVLKQQGHYYDMNCLAYSPDGQLIATGGDDGKVKLWNTTSGFCFVTFSEHSSAVTGVIFSSSGKVIVTASLDGTVRAFDLHRYRNFRTFASPRPVQFSCLTLDPSGEVVCAASHDTFEIFVWSMQTGRLLELLSGHEAPISALSFSPSRALLVSGSWDRTVKLWDMFEQKGNTETLLHTADVVCVTFRPDGEELAVSSLDGQLSFWNVTNAIQTGSIEGRHDLEVGRREGDKVTAKKLTGGICFTSLCYTADGRCILAGGRSKFICIYNVAHQILLKKFQISRNRAFDGMKRMLNSRNMTEAGPLSMLSEDDDITDSDEGAADIKLPGVRKGDFSSRKTRPEIRVKSVQFSPTGRAWAAASTEGLLIYSLDEGVVFDPYDLSEDVTPEGVAKALEEGNFSAALMMSFRLNEKTLLISSIEATPITDIGIVIRYLPDVYVNKLVSFLAERLDHAPHLQFYVRWCRELLCVHGDSLKERSSEVMASLRDLQKSVLQKQRDIGILCDRNQYLLQYTLLRGSQLLLSKEEEEEREGDSSCHPMQPTMQSRTD